MTVRLYCTQHTARTHTRATVSVVVPTLTYERQRGAAAQ